MKKLSKDHRHPDAIQWEQEFRGQLFFQLGSIRILTPVHAYLLVAQGWYRN